jgi:predicted DNA-binding protein (MmcQ/YjbR family)
MNIEDFRNYCIAKKGVTEEFPFDRNTLVFKVMGKIFALTDVEEFDFINLKCDPEEAVLLREKYSAITPGYHMNKRHWNSILTNEALDDHLVFQLIDSSYLLVVKSLSRKLQQELNTK